MLAKPHAGWSEITIGNWSDRCSYLDDVPTLLLDAMTNLLKNPNKPQLVEFDAEGYEYTILFKSYEVFIITEKDETILTQIYLGRDDPITIRRLARELANDIMSSLNDWAKWGYEDYEAAWLKKRYKTLNDKARELIRLADGQTRLPA